jgi:hypothetical protein
MSKDGQPVDHEMSTALYGGHGHAVGRQGATGHAMPPNDSHMQSGARLPQTVYAKPGASGFDDPPADDYGMVDRGT